MSASNNPDDLASSNKVIYPTSKWAIAAFVLGLLAIWPLKILAGIPAIFCGHRAMREIKASQGTMSGSVFARFGMIIGYLEIIFLVVAVITAAFVLPALRLQVQSTLPQIQSAQASH
jgi:hypothetical protein